MKAAPRTTKMAHQQRFRPRPGAMQRSRSTLFATLALGSPFIFPVLQLPHFVRAQSRFAIDLGDVDPKKPPEEASAFFNPTTQQLQVQAGEAHDVAPWAHASFKDSLEKTGWTELRVKTSTDGGIPADLKMYAAGVLEGLLSAVRISQFFSNALRTIIRTEDGGKALKNVMNMLQDANLFVQKKTNFLPGKDAPPSPDPYWKQVRYVYAQVRGLRDGYNLAAAAHGVKELSMAELLLLNSHGELGELLEAYSPNRAIARRRFQAATAVFLQEKATGDAVEMRDANQKRAFLATSSKERQQSDESSASRSSSTRSVQQYDAKEFPFLAAIAEHERERAAKSSAGFSPLVHDVEESSFLSSSSAPSTRSTTTTSSTKDAASTAALADKFWERKLARTGHCSALVRITPDNKDLLVGHTTWDDYAKMTRVFKYYDFPLDRWTASSVVGMSSYPGCVSSTDEFYLLSAGIVLGDTSLEVLNAEVYDRIPEGPKLPSFFHVMAANRMARTAGHWAALLTENNNGLKNAQWFAVDYNRFVPKADVPTNLLWVVETMPGLSEKKDLSSRLMDAGEVADGTASSSSASQGQYFASFNRPIFPEIRQRLGHQDAENSYGILYSADRNPRAQIFANWVTQVETLRDMRMLLRENNYPNEKFLGQGAATWSLHPGHAIAARLDLDPGLLNPNGAIDAKAVNYCLVQKMQMQVISGPSHVKQPVFAWSQGSAFPGWPHLGLPDKYDFHWRQVSIAGDKEDELHDFDDSQSKCSPRAPV
ncbi:unnamed protein product [Amoebophrya sp. A120]|nr:unnamed protein product [Amoebophrya sp. A120]|eukprot:GSA120T00018534001.1